MTAGPAPPSRLHTLDGLRGVAVLGILLMNVNAFAMPFAAYDNPANYGPMRPADVALWAVEFVAVDGKLRAIFSTLFGASLLLFADRAEAAGRNAIRAGLARLAVLLGFGVAHACLVWSGDILVLYAVVGLAALPFRRLPPERLLVLAGLLLLIQLALLASYYQGLEQLRAAAHLPRPARADVAAWTGLLDEIGRPSPRGLALELAPHRGGWPGLVAALVADAPGTWQAELLLNGPETLGLMLLGQAGLKSGFLAGCWASEGYARLARRLYGLALPPLLLLAVWLAWRGFPPLLTAAVTDLGTLPLRPAVAAAHAALLVRWLAGPSSPLKARLVAAGRVAFSNYLGTSLLMTALFEGWGLGLYGRVERWALLPVVLAAWGLMLAWSLPWLRTHAHGPLEWAWRSLASARPARWRTDAIANRLHSG